MVVNPKTVWASANWDRRQGRIQAGNAIRNNAFKITHKVYRFGHLTVKEAVKAQARIVWAGGFWVLPWPK